MATSDRKKEKKNLVLNVICCQCLCVIERAVDTPTKRCDAVASIAPSSRQTFYWTHLSGMSDMATQHASRAACLCFFLLRKMRMSIYCELLVAALLHRRLLKVLLYSSTPPHPPNTPPSPYGPSDSTVSAAQR